MIESNCNKALKVVEQLQKAIEITIEKQIDPGIKKHKNTSNKLALIWIVLKKNLYQIWKNQRSVKSINSNLILE
ncbi:hypothetical protein C2R52_05615 [Helicobacter pylori]|nr:hypothetical protein C2R52_05615 [Helicobacter pylori]